MANPIKGITVTLYEKEPAGADALNTPVFTETPVQVENVLVCPISSQEVTDVLNLAGKRAAYELHIPKTDAHIWEDRHVEFFGQRFETVGFVQAYVAANVPGPWNRRIRAVRCG